MKIKSSQPNSSDVLSDVIIVSAAIRINGLIISAPKPQRHPDIIQRLTLKNKNIPPNDQGFLTNDGLFVSRQLAMFIATINGQLLKDSNKPDLYSEDLW